MLSHFKNLSLLYALKGSCEAVILSMGQPYSQGPLPMSGDTCGCHDLVGKLPGAIANVRRHLWLSRLGGEGSLLASSGQRPRMLLHILQCSGEKRLIIQLQMPIVPR